MQNVPPKIDNPPAWSFDIGGQYTWIDFTTPPTFSGSTGGAHGKITYQRPENFFGQLRSVFNGGNLSASSRSSRDLEWYTEFVGGYCFPMVDKWRFTTYVGMGFDYIWDDKKAHGSLSEMDLRYHIYYVVFGLDLQYRARNWTIGAQLDGLPTFDQTLRIAELNGAAWKLKNRFGVAARFPIGCKLADKIWLETTPYYRLMPIGASSTLHLSKRTLNEYGLFLTFRFFL